jgi:ATP-binding cassette subfamily B protein
MLKTENSKLKFFHQLDSTDCGAACLAMIVNFYGKKISLNQVKSFFEFTRIGVSIQDIVSVSQKLSLESVALKLTENELTEIPLPAILYWKQDHFVIIETIKKNKNLISYYIADPAYGKIKLSEEIFLREWKGNNEKGVAIVSEPSDEFLKINIPKEKEVSMWKSTFFRSAIKFLTKNKFKYIISFILIIVSLLFSFLIPFIFQRIIDNGITPKDINIVYILLAAQLLLFLSSFLSDFFSHLFLTKINFNLSVILKSELLNKLMRLPINYFDTRLNTETLQRLGDQNRIQNFLTWKGIELILDLLNIIVFGAILFYFNYSVFFVYLILSVLSILWVLFFLKRRSTLEYAMFLNQSDNNDKIYEFIMNMPEIKINNAQDNRIKKILNIQEKLNELELKSLFLNTYQNMGVNFLSKLKEIIAFGFCALLIINDNMTLGTLLSVSYVLGQLNGPVQNLVGFLRDAQDANISNKRIDQIYNEKDEDDLYEKKPVNDKLKRISIKNISFKYPGNFNEFVLKDITFELPNKSVTAIVGSSGSGKTTLLKLLLSYYPVTNGCVLLGNDNINDVYSNEWRNNCGIVLQDGHIFSGTIAENIAFSDETIDFNKVMDAAKIAAIIDFIENLPMNYHTKIGSSGIELSGGQKQRILIARAVYKNPDYLFLDEATSALDAENEKIIHDNLQSFFKGKTVIIVAHRLSTVKNADQIIVLKNGEIVEQGNHQSLVHKKADYYNLVKNQLELGN